MQGAADRIVRPEVATPWFAALGSEDKSLWVFRDHLHELLNEPDWQQTLAQILCWLEPRIPSGQALPMPRISELVPCETVEMALPIGA